MSCAIIFSMRGRIKENLFVDAWYYLDPLDLFLREPGWYRYVYGPPGKDYLPIKLESAVEGQPALEEKNPHSLG